MYKNAELNKYELDVLFYIRKRGVDTQRIIAEEMHLSLGLINKIITSLRNKGYINRNGDLTDKANILMGQSMPRNAIILAAGYGLRMAPINRDNPKGLLQIKGEVIVERLINQLMSVGIKEIYIVVGYMKEKYEYLIDRYGVELIYNSKYNTQNNMHSLFCARKYLGNTYIIPCDIWCCVNPFNKYEPYSWYMVSDKDDIDSYVRINRKQILVKTNKGSCGNRMVGIAYLDETDGYKLSEQVYSLDSDIRYKDAFWEDALFQIEDNSIASKLISDDGYYEINTYEQLREVDENSNNLKSDAMDIIVEALKVDIKEIVKIEILKKGMTNRSFLFECGSKKYIMRIPGEGTEQLINRIGEVEAYKEISKYGICDEVKYINAENGYKLTEFYEGARVCDPMNYGDVTKCMKKLKAFHNLRLSVEQEFDLFEQIEFYEKLWGNRESIYIDYKDTKESVLSLRKIIDKSFSIKCLAHIDAVPDNFLFVNSDNESDVRIIDWEYAAMQDPHIDIAMFAIYSFYDREHIDKLIDIYFENTCSFEDRRKIYCYVAACGLLWSNWCEYKRQLGVEFGEYSLRQYRYAKEYYRIVREMKNE